MDTRVCTRARASIALFPQNSLIIWNLLEHLKSPVVRLTIRSGVVKVY